MNKLILLIVFLTIMPFAAHAACSSPAGGEGKIVYNTDHNMLQFCNGTDWIAMGGSASSGSLPSCSDGEIIKSTGSAWGCAPIGCPSGYTESGDKCYKAYGTQTYANAVSTCSGDGAYVAYPTNASDRPTINTMGGNQTIWLGITDAASEGTWLNAQGGSQSYFSWGGGEPNNAGGSEDCVEQPNSLSWNDIPCSISRPFVCERQL